MDKTVTRHDPLTRPLASELVAELRSFTQKFNAVLFQAGINVLHLGRAIPNLWREIAVMVVLNRLEVPVLTEDTRPWARFDVDTISPLPIDYVVQKFAGGDTSFVQRKKEQEDQHIEAGYTGTITVIMCTMCDTTDPPTMLHNLTTYGFGPHSFEAVEISSDWQEQFKMSVAKICGRAVAGSSG